MDHGLELINPSPGNIWKFDFYNFLISWKYWKLRSATFSITWKYGRRAAVGGRLQGLCCDALDYFWNMFLEKRAR